MFSSKSLVSGAFILELLFIAVYQACAPGLKML